MFNLLDLVATVPCARSLKIIHCPESEGALKNQNFEGKHEGILNFRETLER